MRQVEADVRRYPRPHARENALRLAKATAEAWSYIYIAS